MEEHLPKSIMVMVVSSLELNVHEVNGAVRSGEEEQLHHCVVRRYIGSDKIEVPSSVDKRK